MEQSLKETNLNVEKKPEVKVQDTNVKQEVKKEVVVPEKPSGE